MTMEFGIMQGLVDLLYPKICILCKNKLATASSIDNQVCMNCWGEIKRNPPPFCHSCGRHLKKEWISKNICPDCMRTPLHFDRAFSPCVYDGKLKELIHEFKYKNKDYLGKTLSKLLLNFIEDYKLPIQWIDSVIPIPLHKSRLRQREFNQAEILGQNIAEKFAKPLDNRSLIRLRATKTQTELNVKQRHLNVKDSFLVHEASDLKGKNILLVDDILTTGATSSEATRALKNAGANVVFVLTLAN